MIPEQNPDSPRHRLNQLFDRGAFRFFPADPESRVMVGEGRIEGVYSVAFCTDGTRMGGALGGAGARRIAEAIEHAVAVGAPIVGLWQSAGADLREGVEALDGIGQIFAATVRASGRIPQISLVLGPAAGGAAYGPALTDVVIMAPAGRVFVTGPEVVRSVTGEEIDMEGLGGPQVHGRRSGVAHITASSAADAYARTKRITALLGGKSNPSDSDAAPGLERPAAPGSAGPNPGEVLPAQPRRAYDVRPLVRSVVDADPTGSAVDAFQELHSGWASNVVTGLGRLFGKTLGVVANNPLKKGGCLDSRAAEKAARFVRMCDSFGIPLLVIVDVPGYLPGVQQEWEGVVRRGAKLLYAFAEAKVARVTLVTRKTYGGAYIAMNSRALGATTVLAWPSAEVAVMGSQAAVEILHRRTLGAATSEDRPGVLARLIEEHDRTAGGVERGVALGLIDDIIDPVDTRRRVADAIATAPARRGQHGNIPL